MSDDPNAGPPITDELDAALDAIDHLPPASADVGTPGHDLVRAAARRAQAVRLRRDGATYEQIAELAGYSDKSTARKAVLRAFRQVEVESVTELRELENRRLDADETVLRTIIANGALKPETRLKAIDSRTRLSARRSRMNGLDAPVQVALSAGVAADLADALAEAQSVLLGDTVAGVVLSSETEPMEA